MRGRGHLSFIWPQNTRPERGLRFLRESPLLRPGVPRPRRAGHLYFTRSDSGRLWVRPCHFPRIDGPS